MPSGTGPDDPILPCGRHRFRTSVSRHGDGPRRGRRAPDSRKPGRSQAIGSLHLHRFYGLSLQPPLTRRIILQQARSHTFHLPCGKRHSARTACRCKISGSISLPFRGSFRLSFAVLVHYRSLVVFSLGEWSPLIPTGFHVSRGTWVL